MSVRTTTVLSEKGRKLQSRRRMKQNIPLLIMLLPVLIFYIVFKYAPMGGLVIAFKDYNFADGIFGSPWVGWKNFELLFSGANTLNIIRNTFVLSVLRLICGFPAPIILAILLNEVQRNWYRRSLQTIMYMPHFFSWVIMGGIISTIFAQDGVINQLIMMLGGESVAFMYNPSTWIGVFLGSDIWKGMGYGSIIYLAALTSVDPTLYESAVLDGANKWKQIWHITLPSIRSTILTMFILATGNIMDVGFDQIYVLQNAAVNEVADVISTYVYRIGLQGAQYSLATAMGLFESLVGLVLVVFTNRVAKFFGENLW